MFDDDEEKNYDSNKINLNDDNLSDMDISNKSISIHSLEDLEEGNDIIVQNYNINNIYKDVLEDLKDINLSNSKNFIEENDNENIDQKENKIENYINFNHEQKNAKKRKSIRKISLNL